MGGWVWERAGQRPAAGVSRTRAGVAYLWLEWLGHSGPAAARVLGLRPQTIYEAVRRGKPCIGSKSSPLHHNLNKHATFRILLNGWGKWTPISAAARDG